MGAKRKEAMKQDFESGRDLELKEKFCKCKIVCNRKATKLEVGSGKF